MGYEIKGKLHVVFETKQIGDRFSKRDFVVTVDPESRYPQTVLFQATGDRCAQLDGLRKGDEVAIEFSLRGREWTSPSGEVKYFNTLDVWQVTPIGQRQSRSAPSSHSTAPSSHSEQQPPAGADDDIPF